MLVIIVAILILIIFWVYVLKKNSTNNEITDEMEGSSAVHWMSLWDYNNLYDSRDETHFMCKMGGEASNNQNQNFYHEVNERMRAMWNRPQKVIFSTSSTFSSFRAYIIVMSASQITDEFAQDINGGKTDTPVSAGCPVLDAMKQKLTSWYGTFGDPNTGQFWNKSVDDNIYANTTNATAITHFLIQACECIGHVVIYRLMLKAVGETETSTTHSDKVFRMSHNGNKLEDGTKVRKLSAMAYGWSNNNEACTMKLSDIVANGGNIENVDQGFIGNVITGVQNEFTQFLAHMTGNNKWSILFHRNDSFTDPLTMPALMFHKVNPINNFKPTDSGIYEMRLQKDNPTETPLTVPNMPQEVVQQSQAGNDEIQAHTEAEIQAHTEAEIQAPNTHHMQVRENPKRSKRTEVDADGKHIPGSWRR